MIQCSDKQNMIFVTGKMQQGGAEKVLSVLANHYVDLGYRVTIITLLATGSYFRLKEGVELISLEKEDGQTIGNVFSWISEIRTIIKKRQPIVILSFFAKINAISIIAARGLQKKLVISERNDPTSDGRNALVDLVTKALYPFADAIVFQTARACAHFDYRVKRKSLIIPNPIYIDAMPIPFEKRSSNRIVTIGRLDAQKNQKLLIRAVASIRKKHPRVTLDIYGEGPLRLEIEKEIDNYGLGDAVTLHGSVTDVHRRINSAAIFALTSNYEGLSNALMEALSLGLPCVSTNCAGAEDLIKDGVSGFIVPVGDEKAVEDALSKLLQDAALREQIGESARISSDKFASNSVIPKWDSVLIGKGRQSCV